jgi:PAS domain S-box-containing protein
MIDVPRKWLSAPAFDDEDKTRVAGLLNIILLFSAGMNAIDAVAVLLFDARPVSTLLINVTMFIMLIGLLYLTHQGHVTLTSLATCITFWAGVTTGMWNMGGVINPIFGGYIVVILIAGLLLGGRTAAAFAMMSAAIGLLSLKYDLSIEQFVPNPTASAIMLGMEFAIGAFLLYLADRSIKQAFGRARNNEQALKENNRTLEHEITERQQIETALRESEERYRQLLEMSPIAIKVIDPGTQMIYANPAGLKLIGASSLDDLKTVSLMDLVMPEFAETIRLTVERIIKEKSSASVEYTIRRLDGAKIDVELGLIPIVYQGQSALLSVLADITERKRAQAERIKAETLRVELEKERKLLTLKDNFIRLVSHEFRTPLSVIQSSKDLLERYHSRITGEQRGDYLHKIEIQVQAMVWMLDDILTLNKANSNILEFHPEPTPFGTFCCDVFEDFKNSVDTLRNWNFIFPNPCDQLYQIDHKLWRRALWSVLSNAVKFSPEGSVIEFELGCNDREATIRISDKGVGIPADEIEKIFEPFYRCKNAQGTRGMGLGLTIVKTAVEMHGGKIICRSQEKTGSTFEIQLPRVVSGKSINSGGMDKAK